MQGWAVNNKEKITEGRRGMKARGGGWCNNNESNKRRPIFPDVICASVKAVCVCVCVCLCVCVCACVHVYVCVCEKEIF